MLKDKKILFLGSSVTYGSASNGYSFVDYLKDCYGIVVYKEAVSGTTLVDKDKTSYVSRLLNVDPNLCFDAVVCQLSTNDANIGYPISEIQEAIITIIKIVKKNWNCPLVFYTGTQFNNKLYKEMIDVLYDLKDEFNFSILDLWNDEEMNSLTNVDYHKYMADPIHPTRLGYIEWWAPKFVNHLEMIFKSR